MNFVEWEKNVPENIRNDSLWKTEVYRLALFLNDVGWHDLTKLLKDRRTIGLSDQLYRALGSISANIEEGYSRRSKKDQARFYEYSLGSARESRGWYYRGRHVLGQDVFTHRPQLLTAIIRLLLKLIPQQRGYSIREDSVSYQTGTKLLQEKDSITLKELLSDVPFPKVKRDS